MAERAVQVIALDFETDAVAQAIAKRARQAVIDIRSGVAEAAAFNAKGGNGVTFDVLVLEPVDANAEADVGAGDRLCQCRHGHDQGGCSQKRSERFHDRTSPPPLNTIVPNSSGQPSLAGASLGSTRQRKRNIRITLSLPNIKLPIRIG